MTCKILLVEDNQVNQELAQSMLENLGYEVSIANHGKQALAQLVQEQFDAILMDCHMPVMDGFTTAREIRSREQNQQNNTPIIALTASALGSDRKHCQAAGIDDFLAKPFNQASLAEVIRRWVNPEQTSEPANRATEEQALDRLHASSPHQPLVFLRRIIDIYQKNAHEQIAQIKHAAATQDFRQLTLFSHTLKSASAQFGLEEMARLCSEIEIGANSQRIEHTAILALDHAFTSARAYLHKYLQDCRS